MQYKENSENFLAGFSDDSPNAKNGTKSDSHTPLAGSKGSRIAIICLIVLAVVVLSFSLFKFWQKKKREEQYARLLKLFEEDDELELELGLRD
ncbi:OLC1v1038872C3 [Oldenlandia corymbosa var. corymbosa]|uniref:OLC1v1038872C3 n=1 Tax=Oldenlandia corymbosa var. corymbosa TaxID=529605 RepID=A0AAV1D3F9_OLDCO|nr:OLC1v1038872C3 [Oldenlandia corymbosa var. corymbosa]